VAEGGGTESLLGFTNKSNGNRLLGKNNPGSPNGKEKENRGGRERDRLRTKEKENKELSP